MESCPQCLNQGFPRVLCPTNPCPWRWAVPHKPRLPRPHPQTPPPQAPAWRLLEALAPAGGPGALPAGAFPPLCLGLCPGAVSPEPLPRSPAQVRPLSGSPNAQRPALTSGLRTRAQETFGDSGRYFNVLKSGEKTEFLRTRSCFYLFIILTYLSLDQRSRFHYFFYGGRGSRSQSTESHTCHTTARSPGCPMLC